MILHMIIILFSYIALPSSRKKKFKLSWDFLKELYSICPIVLNQRNSEISITRIYQLQNFSSFFFVT